MPAAEDSAQPHRGRAGQQVVDQPESSAAAERRVEDELETERRRVAEL